jgi:hypothetical protein
MGNSGQGPFARAWGHLQETELRLWHMIVAAVVTMLVTTGVPIVVHWSDNYATMLQERSQELVEVSSDFENSVNRLVNSGPTLDSLDPAQLAALQLNIESQIRALNKISPVLREQEQRSLADEYALTLVNVRQMLQDGLRPDETGAFGVAAQELVLTRNKFLKGLS